MVAEFSLCLMNLNICNSIVRKNSRELDGKYAAFGYVTSGMEVIDEIYKNLETDANGMIAEGKQPVISSISSHASHDH